MVFTSFNFLIFFPIVCILFYLTPSKFRWVTLLLTSYFFYFNLKPIFGLLVLFVTVSTYFLTNLIEKSDKEVVKKRFMVLNIVLILLPLFFFKYFSSVNEAIFNLLAFFHIRWPLPEVSLLLPIGISFYTFMAIGYTIDVYNEEIECEKNIGILALFISFFPLVLSGPIERAKNMLPQFKALNSFNYQLLLKGFKLILWGYFMKLVVADRLGIYNDAIFRNIDQHNGTTLLFASFLYPFQVYADLGGYSLIAIGVANILGINVIHNFKRPFFARSMSEFWRKWHISLISWLTDYVYTPLSFTFRKYGQLGIVVALLVTFLISGIWHGANLTFIVWGLVQGLFLSTEALTLKKKSTFEKKYNLQTKYWYIIINILFIFLLFSASQIFGRAENLDKAFLIYSKIFTTSGALFMGTATTMIFMLSSLVLLILKDFFDEFIPLKFKFFESQYKFVRILSYVSIILVILLMGVFDGSQFIYFQF